METNASRALGRSRRGFTLTELLVVITIIAILAALATVGVMAALNTAKQTQIKLEVDNIDMAFKGFKDKFGGYPPCDLRFKASETNQTLPEFNAALMNYVARMFPRYPLSRNRLQADLTALGVNRVDFRPDQALVFWLRGFGPDPTNPFDPAAQRTSLIEFDQTRALLVQSQTTDQIPSYFPPGVKVNAASGAPYVYFEQGQIFDTTSGMTRTIRTNYGEIQIDTGAGEIKKLLPKTFNDPSLRLFAGAGTARPYWGDVTNPRNADLPPTENWVNLESFQIISPGLDAIFSSDPPASPMIDARFYPTGFNYDLTDNDNVTNFARRSKLEDDIP